MEKRKILFTAGKESFVVRVLMKKVEDISAECIFVPFTVGDLDTIIKDVSLVNVYLDDDTHIADETVNYLCDKMRVMGGHVILIGEQMLINQMRDMMDAGILYETFARPVNNDEYCSKVKEYFKKELKEELKKRILVVDDDPQYLNLVREWLKDRYKISMANSGLQAIKFLGKSKVDLILLDYEMPITTGPQVLEMLRADDDTKSIPVMFLTSKDDKNSVMEVVALRPEAYFLKSIKKEELLLKLQDFFVEHP